MTVAMYARLLVIGRDSSPAADGTQGWVMALSWAMLPPKVYEPKMVVVPLLLWQ